MTTIGVSIPVPEPWGTALQDYRVRLGEAAATGTPTHITLLPPVDVEDHLLPGIERHLDASAAAAAPFAAHLRGTGTFRPVSPVVFVNVVAGISSCEVLARAVRRGPLAIDSPYPYHPHVTIAHHLDEDRLDQAYKELADFDCRFLVDRFSLYFHQSARGWQPAREFRLTGT